MQQQAYPEELTFLADTSDRIVPRLMCDLDLYIDEEGLIRSASRIGNTFHFNMRVIHPILLTKYQR